MRGATLAVAVPMIFLVGAIGVVLAGTRDRRLAWPIACATAAIVLVRRESFTVTPSCAWSGLQGVRALSRQS